MHQIMTYYDGTMPRFDDPDWTTTQEQKYGEAFIRDLRKKVKDPAQWRATLEEAWTMFEGHGVMPAQAPEYGRLQANKMDIAQLAAKLTLNSLYGFTGIKIIMAILPMMMLAAAITSIGRHVLELSKNTAERVNARYILNVFNDVMKHEPHEQEKKFNDFYDDAAQAFVPPACSV